MVGPAGFEPTTFAVGHLAVSKPSLSLFEWSISQSSLTVVVRNSYKAYDYSKEHARVRID